MKSLPPNSNNFFVLFNQPVQFEINVAELDKQLRELQKQYHPDKQSFNSSHQNQQTQVDSTSALINHAYQVLKFPDSRASYLLEMAEKNDGLEKSIADLDFLDDAMDIRVTLDESIHEKNTPQLKQLQKQIQERIQQQSQNFCKAYKTENWQLAVDATQKLKFLVKIDADIYSALDQVAQSVDDNDDDLYM